MYKYTLKGNTFSIKKCQQVIGTIKCPKCLTYIPTRKPCEKPAPYKPQEKPKKDAPKASAQYREEITRKSHPA